MTRPIGDRDSAAWWRALCEHQLLLQRCAQCQTVRWPPRAMCNACSGFHWSWVPAIGEGRIVSWTVSYRSFQAERSAPYVVVLVRLVEADNLMLPGSWCGPADGTGLTVDLPVEVSFVDHASAEQDGDFSLLGWRPKHF